MSERALRKKPENKVNTFSKVPQSLKTVMPVLCKLQAIEGKSPEYILEQVSQMTYHKVYQTLSLKELALLRRWLRKNRFLDFTKG